MELILETPLFIECFNPVKCPYDVDGSLNLNELAMHESIWIDDVNMIDSLL